MKTKEEIEQLAEKFSFGCSADDAHASYFAFIQGYTQCQEDMADKLKEAVNLLDKLVENTELFFGYDVANKNSNIRNVKAFINSLNKQD
jgi:hypothetical protein